MAIITEKKKVDPVERCARCDVSELRHPTYQCEEYVTKVGLDAKIEWAIESASKEIARGNWPKQFRAGLVLLVVRGGI